MAETGLGACSPGIPESHGPGKSEGPWLERQGRARTRRDCGIQAEDLCAQEFERSLVA